MIRLAVALVIILQLFIAPMSLFAEEEQGHDHALTKLPRGFANIGFAVLEIPRQMVKTKQDKGDFAGISMGLGKGLVFALGRVLVGAYEIVTFWIPPFEPVIEPEYLFGEEKE